MNHKESYSKRKNEIAVEKAKEYYLKFMENFESAKLSKELKDQAFFISIENFQILNRSKNLEEYRAFFEAYYQ